MARGKSYDEYDARIRVPKGTKLDQSKKTAGAHRALARDAQGNLVGQAEILDLQKPAKRRPDPSPEKERNEDSAIESSPDISSLVPLALVAAAGIAVGAVGIKAAQNAKKKRRRAQVEVPSASAVSIAPAGWYEVAGDSTRLRFWNGVAWTDEYAHRAATAPRIAADWYPDPSNAGQLRYWDGNAWTHHVSPAPGAVTTPADWYPDPSNPAQLRYWDGRAWTGHVANSSSTTVGLPRTHVTASGAGLAAAHPDPKINMSSAEWKAHVEAWLRVGAVQQELWRRLSNAHIQDADGATLEAQRRMEALSPEEGARRIQLMLEANPSLREQGSVFDILRIFRGAPDVAAELKTTRGRDGSP